MITTTQLLELTGVPAGTLASWQHRGWLTPERPGRWDIAEALAVVIFGELMAENRSGAEAAEETIGMVKAVGRFAGMALHQPEEVAKASRLAFVSALVPTADGVEPLNRLVLTDDDLSRLMAVLLRRKAVEIHVRDLGPIYHRVLATFQAARAGAATEQRERVPA